MRTLILTLVLLFLMGCSEKIEVPGERHDLAFQWRIVDREEMLAVYMNSGEEVPEGGDLDGFVGRDPGTDGWVVYTTRPTRLDDRATCTLGHEVLHIVAGDYHK